MFDMIIFYAGAYSCEGTIDFNSSFSSNENNPQVKFQHRFLDKGKDIADKVAKWHNEQFRSIVDSTSALILCDKGLRNVCNRLIHRILKVYCLFIK